MPGVWYILMPCFNLDIPEDELYLQFALEQSMREAAGLAPNSSGEISAVVCNNAEGDMDPELAFAIAESLRSLQPGAGQNVLSYSNLSQVSFLLSYLSRRIRRF